MGAMARQRPPNFNQQEVMRNLDGGTQKQIDSPLMRPVGYQPDGTKLSDDNNPADSGATAATAKKTTREQKERAQKCEHKAKKKEVCFL